MLNRYFERREISGKAIFIVDDHHKALAAWALLRRDRASAPNLISLDFHTDTMSAFRKFAFSKPIPDETVEAIRAAELAALDWRSDSSVDRAIRNLAHDEHIQAATLSGILTSSYSIQLQDTSSTESIEMKAHRERRMDGTRWNEETFELHFEEVEPEPVGPFTYQRPSDGIFVLGRICAIGCQKTPHDEECELAHANQIIETVYLDSQLAEGMPMAQSAEAASMESEPYILDIDLDVFRTWKAVRPDDPTTFQRLIRNAIAITIATEQECVKNGWLDDASAPDVSGLIKAVESHIRGEG